MRARFMLWEPIELRDPFGRPFIRSAVGILIRGRFFGWSVPERVVKR